MINLHHLISRLFPDRRPEWVKAREREFIQAANSLKTLSVTNRGGMSIDPEELREQIVAAREQLKHFVHNPRAHSGSCQAVAAAEVVQEADPSAEGGLDCIEVVAWRRLPSGAAVRYACRVSEYGEICSCDSQAVLRQRAQPAIMGGFQYRHAGRQCYSER